MELNLWPVCDVRVGMRRILPLLALAGGLAGMFLSGTQVPLDRLLQNVEANLDNYPDRAEAHYLLGRLHSLAFSEMTRTTSVYAQPGNLPVLDDRSYTGPARPPEKSSLSAEARTHFERCLENYRKAIGQKPASALYHYSLGWIAEQAISFASELRADNNWQQLALNEYREAYRLSKDGDLATQGHLLPYIATEAGQGVIRLNGSMP